MVIDIADNAGQNLGSIFHKIMMMDLAKVANIEAEISSLFPDSGCPSETLGWCNRKESMREKQQQKG